ncbi:MULTISPECIES: tetratricopeptide repeat protein [Sorangium]|uniref:tetratricopeptide repeat protein n=1 Tax=Sorangium TaxID=39643 RepID=UPI003D9C5C27
MTPEEDEARDRLLFHLENQSGFWFGLVVGGDMRPRARLCEAAAAWCKEHDRAFMLYEPEPDGLVKLAVMLANGGSPGVHWIRADGVKGLIDEWNAGAAQMLMAMNERREAYRKRLDGGIVVEGRSSLKRILRERAPDLFSIRAFIAEPGEEPEAQASGFPEWRTPFSRTSLVSAAQVDPDLALSRLARLVEFEGPATTKSWIDAEGRVMVSLFNTGRYEETARHAHELLDRLEQNAEGALDEQLYKGALAYKILAIIAFLSGNTSESIGLFDKALGSLVLRPAHSEYEQFICGLEVIDVSKRRALVLLHSGDLEGARAALEQRVLTLSTIATEMLPEMQIDLLDSHIMLASALEKQGDLAPAEDVLQKSVQLAKDCAATNPEDDRWQLEILRSIASLGRVQLRKQDIVAAVKTLVPAAALAERLESYGSIVEAWRDVLERFYHDLGFVLAHQVNYSKPSDRIREQALRSIRNQFERSPDDARLGWWLADCYLQRSMLLETEDTAGAKDSAQQALDLVAKLPVRDAKDAELKRKIEALRSFVQKPLKRRRPAKR